MKKSTASTISTIFALLVFIFSMFSLVHHENNNIDYESTYHPVTIRPTDMPQSVERKLDSAEERTAWFYSCNGIVATTIKLNTKSLSLVEGNTSILKATVEPSNAGNQDFQWKSSNTKVAVVFDDGVVMGVGIGNAIITCTIKNGLNIRATCKVTVTETSIKLNTKSLSLVQGDTSILKATVEPSNKKIIWLSSDEKVATIDRDNGKVTGIRAGTALISCITNTESDGAAICNVNVTEK